MELTVILFLVFLLIVTVVSYWICFSLFLTLFYDAPFVPLKRDDRERLKKLTCFQKNTLWYELGSGDGSNLIFLSKQSGIDGVGIERSRFLYYWSRFRVKRNQLHHRITIQRGNFFRKDISKADGVLCYLFPKAMEKLAPKFQTELRNGTFIVSVSFSIPGWKPIETHRRPNGIKTIYVYKIGNHLKV